MAAKQQAARTGHDVEGLYIGQVAQLLGVTPETLRSWERQGLIDPQRTRGGYRVYDADNLTRLRGIRRLVRDDLNASAVRRILHTTASPGVSHSNSTSVGAGERIRAERAKAGLSLRGLARRSGLSASYLGAIERGASRPSVATLQTITAALGTTLSQMLAQAPGDDEPLVGPTDRRSLELGVPGVSVEQLAAVERLLEPSLVRVAPGAGSEADYAHEGEEFVLVLEGSLQIGIENLGEYLLETGDAITFRSNDPHNWRNPGATTTLALWVNTPPTF